MDLLVFCELTIKKSVLEPFLPKMHKIYRKFSKNKQKIIDFYKN